MNNVNVSFEVEDSIKCFSINEKESIINIKNVKSSHRINFAIFKENEINEIFNEFRHHNVNKYDENRVYVFAIVILRFIIISFIVFFLLFRRLSKFFCLRFLCFFRSRFK